ncbi:MAG TPA: PEP-CTERM sorting domain-containing protein [Candidatus Acidoferrum sp.]|nr:PEP-CTERM sorting domain-containing protein [Candidatus Acidoferrum sp.]
MRRILLGLGFLALACVASSPVFADSVQIQYTVNGAFSADVNSAPLSGANGTYSMSFSLPQDPSPDFFDTTAGDFAISNVPISYSFQCQSCSSATTFSGTALDVDFAGPSLGGMFVVELLTGGHDYFFQFGGPTLFSGSVSDPTLLTGGPFNLTNAGYFELDDNEFVNLGSATVQASQVATPEPSTLALLLAAMLAVGAIAFWKSQRS